MESVGETQRSRGAHSGLTPSYEEKRLIVDQFLTGINGLQEIQILPTPPPLPGSEPRDPAMQPLLDGQQALIKGVNELRSSVVTRESLAELYQLQRD